MVNIGHISWINHEEGVGVIQSHKGHHRYSFDIKSLIDNTLDTNDEVSFDLDNKGNAILIRRICNDY